MAVLVERGFIMKVSYDENKNLACIEFNPKYRRAEAIITKLNIMAWDIAERSDSKVLFKVENKEDYENLKRITDYCLTHDFYY